MGSAASIEGDDLDKLDAAAVKQIVGERFDEKRFSALAEDGQLTVKQLKIGIAEALKAAPDTGASQSVSTSANALAPVSALASGPNLELLITCRANAVHHIECIEKVMWMDAAKLLSQKPAAKAKVAAKAKAKSIKECKAHTLRDLMVAVCLLLERAEPVDPKSSVDAHMLTPLLAEIGSQARKDGATGVSLEQCRSLLRLCFALHDQMIQSPLPDGMMKLLREMEDDNAFQQVVNFIPQPESIKLVRLLLGPLEASNICCVPGESGGDYGEIFFQWSMAMVQFYEEIWRCSHTRVISLQVLSKEAGILQIRCCSLAGEELMQQSVDAADELASFHESLVGSLESDLERVRLVLPDGRSCLNVLAENHRITVGEVFSPTCPGDDAR